MARRLVKFWMTAMVGYGFVVSLLAGGMILTTHRFDVVASGHIDRIRREESQITSAERLRVSGEAIVSAGRGYVITSDPSFLVRLDQAKADFDRKIKVLAEAASDAQTTALMTEVHHNAIAARQRQDFFVDSMQTEDPRTLAQRFETELVPLNRELVRSLDRLIDHKQDAIGGVYERVADERALLVTRFDILLGILVLASLGIAVYIARLLGRSYQKEQRALEISRKAVAARDEIMGMVAHDLRNPLSSISLRAQLLREGAESEEATKHATGIETVTLRMESMIKTMLDVATIESGHFAVNTEACPACELVEATLDMFRDLAAGKQVRLEHRAMSSTTFVRADRERVLQVLQNLVGNALKFTPPGGRIVITTERQDRGVRFRIADTGPGIATEHLSRVFDRFWKHEGGGKKGTGLGLFIAKGIVEAHGGQIGVESKPGTGASFFFTLPRTDDC